MNNLEYPPSILVALHEIMGKVGYVQKKDENKFHHYKYAGEGALLAVLRPAMVEAGLLLIPSTREQSEIDQYGNTTVTIEYTLAHKDGSVWPEKIVAMGSGNDKNSKGGVGDKGLYKALTGANKYLLFKLFQIETGDDPEKTEAETPKPKTAWHGPLNKIALNKAIKAFDADLLACADTDQLCGLLEKSVAVLQQLRADRLTWWTGEGDIKGMATKIDERKAELDNGGSASAPSPDAGAGDSDAPTPSGHPGNTWAANAILDIERMSAMDEIETWWAANQTNLGAITREQFDLIMKAKQDKEAFLGSNRA